MGVESADDLAGFFDTDEHATTATWNGKPVKGIFENPYLGALAGQAGVMVDTSNPTFTCREADVLGIAIGDAITIGGVAYDVMSPQPDGTGVITLELTAD